MRDMNKKKLYAYNFEKLSASVMQSQLSCLSRFGVFNFWANVLSANLLCALLWFSHPVSQIVLVIWYASILLLSGFRWYISSYTQFDSNTSRADLDHFAQRYLMSGSLLTALWGISGALFYVAEPLMLALHLILLFLIAASILPVVAISRRVLYFQIAVLLLPSALMLIAQFQPDLQLLGVGLIMLSGLIIVSCHILYLMLDNMQATQLRMMEQINTDPVTQLANRRYFEQMFKLEWRRAARDSEPLALLMVDVDQFKLFNDEYGHDAGDRCLQTIARCLRSVAQRASDIVARHGGEEFVVLLPTTTLQDAMRVAEQLRESVEKKQLGHSSINDGVTISIGVSCCTPSVIRDETEAGSQGNGVVFPAMLLRAADAALYRAKRNGRNQVAQEACGEIRTNLSETVNERSTLHVETENSSMEKHLMEMA